MKKYIVLVLIALAGYSHSYSQNIVSPIGEVELNIIVDPQAVEIVIENLQTHDFVTVASRTAVSSVLATLPQGQYKIEYSLATTTTNSGCSRQRIRFNKN